MLRQGADERAKMAALSQIHVIEVERTRGQHAVCRSQDNLGGDPSDGPCHGDNDDLIQPLAHELATQEQDRATFVRRAV